MSFFLQFLIPQLMTLIRNQVNTKKSLKKATQVKLDEGFQEIYRTPYRAIDNTWR